MIFLFLRENVLWYSLEAPLRGASNEYHNICFRGEIGKWWDASNKYHNMCFRGEIRKKSLHLLLSGAKDYYQSIY